MRQYRGLCSSSERSSTPMSCHEPASSVSRRHEGERQSIAFPHRPFVSMSAGLSTKNHKATRVAREVGGVRQNLKTGGHRACAHERCAKQEVIRETSHGRCGPFFWGGAITHVVQRQVKKERDLWVVPLKNCEQVLPVEPRAKHRTCHYAGQVQRAAPFQKPVAQRAVAQPTPWLMCSCGPHRCSEILLRYRTRD
jgi:hypothetical protein